MADIRVSTTGTDADWIVKVIDVFPDSTSETSAGKPMGGYQMHVRSEMIRGRERLESRLGVPIRHFAYPFGGRAEVGAREISLAREAGFNTAVTTRHANLQREHCSHLHALPRISVNGFHQSTRDLAVLLSGASSAMANRLRRVVTL